MKTYQIRIVSETEQESVEKLLSELKEKGSIEFQEVTVSAQEQSKATAASEDQVEEMIDEAELGPYYTEEEAKNILKL